MAGAAAEEGITREDGIEIAIKLDDGNFISVVQQANKNEEIKPGDRVRVIEGDGATRVTKL
jgi:outer membrane lipoprotein SlyB